MVRALVCGLTIVAACSGGESAQGPSGTSLRVDPPQALLAVDERVRLQAVVTDGSGSAVPGAAVFWSIRDPSVAEITAEGEVIARAVGATEVAASYGGQSAVAAVTVTPVRVARLDLSSTGEVLNVGDVRQLGAVPRDASGRALEGRVLVWRSANEQVARVDGNGRVTAVGAGTTEVSAECEGVRGTVPVEVRTPPPPPPPPPAVVTRVTLTPSSAEIDEGKTRQFQARAYDAAGKEILGRAVKWSTADTRIATVSTTGLVRGVKEGLTTVLAAVDGATGVAAIRIRD